MITRARVLLGLILVLASAPSAFSREYPAEVVRILDGDTLEVDLDLGLGLRKRQLVRLDGIDAPELRGPGRVRGQLAKQALDAQLSGKRVTVTTRQDALDKYGRLLGVVKLGSVVINEAMVMQGRAIRREYE